MNILLMVLDHVMPSLYEEEDGRRVNGWFSLLARPSALIGGLARTMGGQNPQQYTEQYTASQRPRAVLHARYENAFMVGVVSGAMA